MSKIEPRIRQNTGHLNITPERFKSNGTATNGKVGGFTSIELLHRRLAINPGTNSFVYEIDGSPHMPPTAMEIQFRNRRHAETTQEEGLIQKTSIIYRRR